MSQNQANEPDWSVFDQVEDTPEDEYFTEQAEFCLASGISPSEYDLMTRIQLSAWIAVLNKRNRQ